jgi:hypothetical protein
MKLNGYKKKMKIFAFIFKNMRFMMIRKDKLFSKTNF